MRISDCDVICDLLPSYIDGICTEATRRCVEEPLADCPACEARARRLRETALSGESLERIALDAAKKIKRRAVWQTTVRLALLLPFIAFASLGLNLVLRGRDVIFTGQNLPKHGFSLSADLRGLSPGLGIWPPKGRPMGAGSVSGRYGRQLWSDALQLFHRFRQAMEQ